MKTNFGKKSLLVLITSVSMLAACNNPSNGNSANSGVPSSLRLQVEDTTSQKTQLPDSVTGLYAKSSADCKAGSYPSYAHVNTITSQDNGYNISADAFGLELTLKEGLKSKLLKRDRQYRIVLDPQGNKIELFIEDLASGKSVSKDLVRCRKAIKI